MIFIFLIFIQYTLQIDYAAESLRVHEQFKGKLTVKSRVAIQDKEDLSIAYTPGVAEPCKKIHDNIQDVYKYTIKGHTVAVVSDGTAVLGLGDIGPEAAMPVMEGKSVLFKEFGDVDAFPICLDTKEPAEIIKTVKYISPTFGGINLEDISSPRCFEIEETLKEELDIPVFHDDQHGTAIVVTAGIINSLKIVKKEWKDLKIVVAGAGAAGLSVCKLLMHFGPDDIILTNRKGAVYEGRPDLNPVVAKMAKITNKHKKQGSLADVLVGADIFIGVSGANLVTSEMVKTMNKDAIVFALANPIPEIMPEDAFEGGARIVATGRSDFPNQINNVLVFPGLFRGALMVRSKKIVDDMKVAAARALASLVSDRELNEKYIIPEVFDKRCAKVIAEEVATVAEYLDLAQNKGNREW
ncbi:MAG: NADP-dependent malic enzyme [Clostridia bacterium]|nr:NADP-dependent malic enzyme [Clostridia bacterium]